MIFKEFVGFDCKLVETSNQKYQVNIINIFLTIIIFINDKKSILLKKDIFNCL